MVKDRISRKEMFMSIAEILSKRSLCTRKKVGAVLVLENRIIATGYNGTLPDVDNKYAIDAEGNSRTVHAEANVISFCARNGIKTKGSDLYLTLSPCERCAEIITQAGIKRVFYSEEYRDKTGIEVLNNQDIVCLRLTR